MNELVPARPDEVQSCAVRFRDNMQAALRLIFDFALPPLCPSCREPLGEGTGLCAPCWSKLSLIELPYCARLGIPLVLTRGQACCRWKLLPTRPLMTGHEPPCVTMTSPARWYRPSNMTTGSILHR